MLEALENGLQARCPEQKSHHSDGSILLARGLDRRAPLGRCELLALARSDGGERRGHTSPCGLYSTLALSMTCACYAFENLV